MRAALRAWDARLALAGAPREPTVAGTFATTPATTPDATTGTTPDARADTTPTLEITVPGRVPSTNHLYATAGGRRILSAQGRQYKTAISTLVHATCRHALPLPITPYALHLTVHDRWRTSNGQPVRADATNRIKVLEDALSEGLGIDDRWFWEVTVTKRDDPYDPRVIARLTPWQPT